MDTLLIQRRNTLVKTAVVIALILAAFFPAKYTNSIYGYLPGLGFLALFLLSAFHLMIVGRAVRFEVEALDSVCQRGESVNAAIKIVNKSVLPCPKVHTCLSITDIFAEEGEVFSKSFILNGKSEIEFPLTAKMRHIGVYTVGVKTLRVYDLLGLFSLTLKGGKTFQITVLPKTCVTEEIRLDERQLTESQNVQKTAACDGFDYTGVREYALGDSMKRIHWKLSAHSSTYMTKITESSKRSDLTVIIDFVALPFNHEVLANLYDCLIETALSIIEQASSKDIEYSLLFIGRDHELIRTAPKRERDYPDLVGLLPKIDSNPDSDILDGADILEKEKHLSNKSSNIILCTSRITRQLMQELISVRQQQRNPELYTIIPADRNTAGRKVPLGNGDERDDPEESLGILDDYGIRYHLIPAETEGNQ